MVRILITIIAPIILFFLYLLHRSHNSTHYLQAFLKKLSQNPTVASLLKVTQLHRLLCYLSAMGAFRVGGSATGSSNVVAELAEINHNFWVRLTQVLAAVIGY